MEVYRCLPLHPCPDCHESQYTHYLRFPRQTYQLTLVVALWNPVAIKRVIFASGLPSLISFSINGIICLLGTGLVWSEQIITTFSFPFASSESFGEPIGCAIASRTISSSVLSLFGMDSMDEDKTS